MKPQTRFIICFVFILVSLFLLMLIFSNLPYIQNKQDELPANYVTRVIDGDTFQTASGEIIRLLCVNTPEKGKEGYEEATSYLENMILSKEVLLKPSITNTDKYGRSLRYVYVNDTGMFVNQMILDSGYGELLVIPPETCEEMN
jgi:micrococcal nuclease